MIFNFTITHCHKIYSEHWLNQFTAPAATLLGAPLLRGAGGQSGQRRKARLASERARAHATTRRAAHRARCAKRNTLLGQPHVCLHSWPRNQTVDQLRCCCCCCCRVACHSHRRAPQPPAARRVDACLCVSLPFSGRAANSHARRRRTPRQPHKVFVLITPQRRLKASKPRKQLESQLSKERKKVFWFGERRTKLNSQEKKEINFYFYFYLGFLLFFQSKIKKLFLLCKAKLSPICVRRLFWRASLISKKRACPKHRTDDKRKQSDFLKRIIERK